MATSPESPVTTATWPSTSDEAIDAMLGPTGNLRAPTLRSGQLLLVGFNEEAFEQNLLG